MSKSSYSVKPSTFEAYAKGKTLVNYNVQEVERETEEGKVKEWECDQVICDSPVTYPALVDAMVRAEYAICDELAILRQRSTKKEDFNTYNAFVESCKVAAKEVLGID